jgi:hypothetical protein
MALENKEQGQYITIYRGKLAQRVQRSTQGAIQRINKNGKEVCEKYYDRFIGQLVGINTKDSDYGRQWIFSFKDEGEIYHLQLPYSNSFSVAFLKMLPNINLAEKMEFSPSNKLVDGKNQSSLFIKQNGVNIKHAFTKDNPNGLPAMEKIIVKGKEVWDDSKRLAFLEKMVVEKILPGLKKITGDKDVLDVQKQETDLNKIIAEEGLSTSGDIDVSQIDF